jgi:hypothetical protein
VRLKVIVSTRLDSEFSGAKLEIRFLHVLSIDSSISRWICRRMHDECIAIVVTYKYCTRLCTVSNNRVQTIQFASIERRDETRHDQEQVLYKNTHATMDALQQKLLVLRTHLDQVPVLQQLEVSGSSQ